MIAFSSRNDFHVTVLTGGLKSGDVSRHEIGSIFELPRDVDVIQCFDIPVKTSCGYVNMAKKAENARWNFFQSKLQVFPHLERV